MYAANKLIKGERALGWVALAMGTDMEGTPARLIDKLWPKSGLGTSEPGMRADPVADTGAMIALARGILKSPRVPKTAKLGTAIILAQEVNKARWVAGKARDFKERTISEEFPKGEVLNIPVTLDAKEATVEKMFAEGLATLTNEIESPFVREIAGFGSLYFAISGAVRAEKVRRGYDAQYEENPMIYSQTYQAAA
jgi:hypothetical protein